MRDIKFRAWDYQYNRWATESVVSGSVGLVFGIKDYFINIAGEKSLRFSFQQYTGLKDKNGKDIYEGDIIKSWYSRDTSGKDIIETIEEVKYEINEGMGRAGYEIMFLQRAEVIGNIYETPELVK